jgi:SIR2-like domain
VIYSDKDYALQPLLAAPALGQLLHDGALGLFIGAGVSSGFGLPKWKELIARILAKEHDADFVASLATKSTPDLCRLINPIDDGSPSYVETVHKALYRDVKPRLADQLVRSPLLLAVAALITGSCRGRVDSITTYNYDDLLEQYAHTLGYTTCRRTQFDDLSTRADVEINYPHGSLPQSWTPEDDLPQIILSNQSYRDRRTEIRNGWSSLIQHKLYTKIGLFVGLSGDDDDIIDNVQRAKNQLERGSDYNAYWLLTPDAFQHNKDVILHAGSCPIPLQVDDIPRFLFEVCQKAL